MADKFGSGLQMGMQMARDVRSANLASADRRERSKYRERAETREDRLMGLRESKEEREVSAEERAVQESDLKTKSIKRQMRRGRKADTRAGRELDIKESAEERSVEAAELVRKINKHKLDNLKDPSVGDYRSKKRLLEDYQKDTVAADKRHADQMGPLNAAIDVAERTNSPDLPNLLAMREKMLANHKDFKAGLEQSFMAASNRPYEGKWSIRPYFNEFTNTMSYGAMFEGGSASEATSAFESIKAMGGTVGISAGASAATPARSVDPNDPGGIRPQTRAAP
jgi:hypothetical protein